MAAMNNSPTSCPSGFDAVEPHREVYQHGDGFNDFKRLVVHLADALDDEDSRRKIRYLYKDRLGPGGDKMKTLEILEKLEEKGVFSARKVNPLESLLRDIDRCDLIDVHLEPHKERYPPGCNLAPAGEYSSFHHSKSLPDASGQPSPPHTTAPPRSTSHPVPITATITSKTGPTSDMPSIQEEHQSFDDRQSLPSTATSKRSLFVFGTSTTEVSSEKRASLHSLRKQSPDRNGSVQSTNSSCYLPPDQRKSQDKRMKQSAPSVNVMNDVVTFRVGGDVSTPSTLPRDVDSQLNFPMENGNATSPGTSPAEVRSKLSYPAQGESLTSALTRSFHQADERSRTNTPLFAIDKSAVEATDQSTTLNLASVVTGQDKPHPQLNTEPTAAQDRGRGVKNLAAAVANGAVNIACATLSLEHSTPDRRWQSKPKSCSLNREKMAVMISKQKISHCYKCLSTTIPISNSRKGLQLVSELFPCGRDGELVSRHASVLVHVSVPTSSTKCKELLENCNCLVEVQLTFVDSNTQEMLSKVEGKAELSSTTCKGCVHIENALSHEHILYRKTKHIQLQVEAVFICRDKVVAAPLSDSEHADYLEVTTNCSSDRELLVSQLKECKQT